MDGQPSAITSTLRLARATRPAACARRSVWTCRPPLQARSHGRNITGSGAAEHCRCEGQSPTAPHRRCVGTLSNREMFSMIVAGKKCEVMWGEGNWIFLDIGFSGAANARGKTSGLLFGEDEPQLVNFSEAAQKIVTKIKDLHSTINLVIEAPLSVCFRNGNPTGRLIEKAKGKTHRVWYVGAGCAVMVASMYLIRKIADAKPPITIRLFEGFISYKSEKSDHKRDTMLMREVVKTPEKGRIIDKLNLREDDIPSSAFHVIGLDCGVPAVIMPMTKNQP